jgi:small subunit ribosomal protein S17
MAKVLTGKVIATKMQDTVVVQVSRRVPHPLYRKLMKKDQNFKVDTKGQEISVGDQVKIVETKPISKDKHFKIFKVVKGKAI